MKVSSEIGHLQKVLIHQPDIGISRITPKQSDELLFDDIVHYPKILEEHKTFVDILTLFLGEENVVKVEKLLAETLTYVGEEKLNFLLFLLKWEGLPLYYSDYLLELNTEDLAQTLITGFHKQRNHYLFDPIPNLIFTRDIGVMVNQHLIITKAAKSARYRENFIAQFIFKNHPTFLPLFEREALIDLTDPALFPPSKSGQSIALEGGDLMMLSEEILLVGCSERSNHYTIQALKDNLFQRGIIKQLVQINIPSDRAFMHLDTILTRISDNIWAGFKPLIHDGQGSNVLVYHASGQSQTFTSFKDYIIKEYNPNTTFAFCGDGESPYQEREQWTDACNLVTLKPGIALAYDRNIYTEKVFQSLGYSIIKANDLIAQALNPNFNLNKLENTIITLPSAELSRARGGSHCMTCPLDRADFS